MVILMDSAIFAFARTSSHSLAQVELWAGVGAAFGIFVFVRGFIMLQYKRLILNTPSSKVRSAAMGLVEITGMAKGPATINAGITGSSCYYYRAVAWQLRQAGKNREWQCVANESCYVPFFVEDSTGKLMIDPEHADLDLMRDFKDEFDTSFFSSNDRMLPEGVAEFLARNGVNFTDNTRVEEYCIKPDSPLFVLGTLCTNGHQNAWEAGAHIATGSPLTKRFNLFGSMSGGMLQSLTSVSGSTLPVTFGTTISASPRPTYPASGPASRPAASAAPKSSWAAVSMDDVAMNRATPAAPAASASSVATADLDSVPEDLRSNLPDNGGFDMRPPVCISKGPTKDPFMISWRSQREVVRSLAWKSALCIWGGPALTLASLYFLAAALGWT
jgi:E3 Ubiquitin ligase